MGGLDDPPICPYAPPTAHPSGGKKTLTYYGCIVRLFPEAEFPQLFL